MVTRSAVINNVDEFKEWLSSQPLCMWAANKQQRINRGEIQVTGRSPVSNAEQPKSQTNSENDDLLAALANMA